MALRYTFKTQPWVHQRKALARIVKLDWHALLAMPMRTGKTKVSIDAAGILHHNLGLRRVLIVTPISVMGVWRDEIAVHCPVPSRVTLLNGSVPQRMQQVTALGADQANNPGIDWVIVNYEAVWRDIGRRKMRLDQVIIDRFKPDLVIADESHRIKTPTSKQARSLARLGAAARFRLALTGTPVTRTPLDVFGQFRFVDPAVMKAPDGTPHDWSSFKNRYAVYGGFQNRELKGYKNLDELLPRIRDHSYRVKLEDCFELRPREFVTVPVALSDRTRGVYRDMAKQMIVELESGKVSTASIVLTKLLRLSQITSGFLRTEDGGDEIIDSAKLDACMDLVTDMTEQGEKAVVFCRFKIDYQRVMAACLKARLGPSLLSGETPQAGREGLLRRFREDPACKVFISQTAAGSLGIDLTAARFSIFYSLDYNWATYAQAVERIYGPKQTRPVTVYHLIAPRTVDKVVLDTLQRRGDLADQVIHNPKMLLDAFSGEA